MITPTTSQAPILKSSLSQVPVGGHGDDSTSQVQLQRQVPVQASLTGFSPAQAAAQATTMATIPHASTMRGPTFFDLSQHTAALHTWTLHNAQ